MAERVLIIEDETAVAKAVAYALEREGFGAAVAGDAGEALSGSRLNLPTW